MVMEIKTTEKRTRLIGLELRVTPAGGRQHEAVILPLDIEVVAPDPQVTGKQSTWNATLHTTDGDANTEQMTVRDSSVIEVPTWDKFYNDEDKLDKRAAYELIEQLAGRKVLVLAGDGVRGETGVINVPVNRL